MATKGKVKDGGRAKNISRNGSKDKKVGHTANVTFLGETVKKVGHTLNRTITRLHDIKQQQIDTSSDEMQKVMDAERTVRNVLKSTTNYFQSMFGRSKSGKKIAKMHNASGPGGGASHHADAV
eukprot:CAMPEP_0119298608 /NCGR_PEP_ID=MMETSP1333-20130426/767_1 /TAXON_ID=418940 /ORGANISM="Scyphosphaera apsteinii, Strain RCC1455" /LENGTH=122 /DNA_ID=CAMNT_0007299757 /DNA_START=177 /DNA_END=545 /DNA_ORIENTATION=-